MARGFYTVIVGTQPGIYTDWYLPASWFTLEGGRKLTVILVGLRLL
jgi:hypothetical protein